jgi:cytidyltransferase-like protein
MIKVFVSGCYDILHAGHIDFFEQAKALGDYLIVCFASDKVLIKYKNRKSSLPEAHKRKILASLRVVDKVVMGKNVEREGLDFYECFLAEKPDILAVTQDDKYEQEKRKLCAEIGCQYVILPKTPNPEFLSTSKIVSRMKCPTELPLRVDFAGGWLDVPRYARQDGFIVNCAITPKVSLANWTYEMGSGLGGSAARAILKGKPEVYSEIEMGVGWQDPAIILETGLCVWKSGKTPHLEIKRDPETLKGNMAVFWTGESHSTASYSDKKRDYLAISTAGKTARDGVLTNDLNLIAKAVDLSYQLQLNEAMIKLPDVETSIAKKYCGGGNGGYALYLFSDRSHRDEFVANSVRAMAVEPYIN